MGFLKTTRGKIITGAIGLVVLVALIALMIWLSVNGYWPYARDIAVVALAVFSFVPIAALTYAIIQVARLAKSLRAELTPILTELKETTHSITETAKVASEFTVKPAIKTASFLVGFSQVVTTILGQGEAGKRREARRHRNAEAAKETAKHQHDEQQQPVKTREEVPHGHR